MAEALAKMKEEMDRKRKLREESLAAGSEGGGPKKKVYLTKGQLKQLDEKKASGGGAADAGDGADDEALSDSPKKNGLGDASGGVAKKYIPAHEVVRRLRCAATPPFPSQPPPLPPLLLNLHERHCSSCFAFSRHYSLRECNYSLRECAIPASALGSRKCSRADDAAAHFNLDLILIAGSPHRPILKQNCHDSDSDSNRRELKQPIRTFGETDEARMARLRQVEISRPDDDHGGGQKNFMNDRKRAEKEKAAQGGDSSDEEELTPAEKQSKRREKLIRIHIQEEQAEKGEDFSLGFHK
jgi:hypothetical protein